MKYKIWDRQEGTYFTGEYRTSQEAIIKLQHVINRTEIFEEELERNGNDLGYEIHGISTIKIEVDTDTRKITAVF